MSDPEGPIAVCNEVRATLKDIATVVLTLKGGSATPYNPEATANIMLAYRHLEDASMRLGKVIQALDGGVSVYDKATTVGS